MEVDILNKIYDIAIDQSFSEHEALTAIIEIVEDRLAQFGLFPHSHNTDPN